MKAGFVDGAITETEASVSVVEVGHVVAEQESYSCFHHSLLLQVVL